MKLLSISLFIFAILTVLAPASTSAAPPLSQRMQFWFYLRANLQDATQFNQASQLIDRAAAAGYTGIFLNDPLIELPNAGGPYHAQFVNQFLAHAATAKLTVIPQTFPFGYSDMILGTNPNLAEGQPVIGANFIVSPDGASLVFNSSLSPNPLTNGGFETHSGNNFSGWDYQNQVVADTTVFHNGTTSLRMDPGTNGMIRKNISVQPWRQYHISFWMRVQGSVGTPVVDLIDATTGQPRNYTTFALQQNQWVQYDFIANSETSTALTLRITRWGGSTGTLWFDDVSIDETALVNLLRRSGTPLRVYNPSNTITYNEGADYNSISDPLLHTGGQYGTWHQPPSVTLPVGTTLAPNAQVKMDYYAVAPTYKTQVGASLTAPEIQTYMTNNMSALATLFPTNSTSFLLNYDEMRHMNTSQDAAAMGKTAGQLLAWHVGQATTTVRSVFPNSTLYFWNDMFDPNHNAVNNYYLVGRDYGGQWNGDISGSWLGLPSDAVIMNWNLNKLNTSLIFFSNLGYRQIITGYFDSGNGTASATNELTAAQGINNVLGMMYTTWNNDYSQLENYAAAAQPPTITSNPASISVAPSQATTFTVSASGPGTLSYQWQRNGVDIPGATSATYAINAATLADNGAQFRCRATNLGGYVTSNSATVTIAGLNNLFLPLIVR